MIEVLAGFAPHFEPGEIEDIARRMDIWRQPLADLESPNILRYKYSSKMTWRTWPKSSPLDRFEQVGKLLSKINAWFFSQAILHAAVLLDVQTGVCLVCACINFFIFTWEACNQKWVQHPFI